MQMRALMLGASAIGLMTVAHADVDSTANAAADKAHHVVQTVGNAVEKAGHAAVHGVAVGAKAAADGVETGAKATAGFAHRAAEAVTPATASSSR